MRLGLWWLVVAAVSSGCAGAAARLGDPSASPSSRPAPLGPVSASAAVAAPTPRAPATPADDRLPADAAATAEPVVTSPAATPPAPEGASFGRGPFARREDACATCRRDRAIHVPPASRSHLQAVELVSAPEASDFGTALTNTGFYLSVKTPDGWYLRRLGMEGLVCGFETAVHVDFRPPTIVVDGSTVRIDATRCDFTIGPPRCDP